MADVEEREEQEIPIPGMWQLAIPVIPEGDDEEEEESSGTSKSKRAPPPAKLGKLIKMLNDIEDPEELEAKVQERDPASGQTLLTWATLNGKFVFVEWLLKKTKRAAFGFYGQAGGPEAPEGGIESYGGADDEEGDEGHENANDVKSAAFQHWDADNKLAIFDKWIETRKELEEQQKHKVEEEEARRKEKISAGENPDNKSDEEENEEENAREPESTPEQLVYEALSEYHDDWGKRGLGLVKLVGEFGFYQGNRDDSHGENVKSGLGQTLFPNNDVYTGEYKDNKRDGKGTYYWSDKAMFYTGDWHENIREGIGRMVYPDGGRYMGQWYHDHPNGQGRYTYPDGSSYTGSWRDGIKLGLGTYQFTDGSQYIGLFLDGEFISGEWRLTGRRTRYYGSFKDDVPLGSGVFIFKHGTDAAFRQEGQYIEVDEKTYEEDKKRKHPITLFTQILDDKEHDKAMEVIKETTFVLKDSNDTPVRLLPQIPGGGDSRARRKWVPYGQIISIGQLPKLRMVLQRRELALTFTDECAGMSMEQLVAAANFPPFLDWITRINKNENSIFLESVKFAGVRFIDMAGDSPYAVQEVRLKVIARDTCISVLNPKGRAFRGTENIVLKYPKTRLLCLVYDDHKRVVLMQNTPSAVLSEEMHLSLPTVEVSGNGRISGHFIDLVNPAVRLELNTKSNTFPLFVTTPIQGSVSTYNSGVGICSHPEMLLVDAQSSLAAESTLVYIQKIHPDTMATLQHRLDTACHVGPSMADIVIQDKKNEENMEDDIGMQAIHKQLRLIQNPEAQNQAINNNSHIYQVRAVDIQELLSDGVNVAQTITKKITRDAMTIASLVKVVLLVRGNMLPLRTVAEQRPPTPRPPAPETRPDIEALLEEERRKAEAQKQLEAEEE